MLDLILELQMAKRKRRSTSKDEDDEKNATLAAHSLMRGFLNTLDTSNGTCAQMYYCQGVQEASKRGDVGRKMARIAR